MYRLYAAINFLTNEQRPVTVGYSVEAMCSKSADGRRVPDPKKIRARYRALFSYLFSKVSKETYSKFRQKLAKLAKARRIGISRLVSGKSCLLKHLHALMKGVAKFRGDEKQLVAMLAASTSPRAEPGLRRVLTKICS